MTKPFYVTTPIYYVNDIPHLGTAYTTVITDAFRRFHLLLGEDVRMLTGTDEHGLKLEREALARGQTPKAFVDEISARFREAWPKLLVESDDFIRTTDERHERVVHWLWQRIEKAGDLELGSYDGWYCVGCESFKTEKELLPENLCPIHKKPVEWLKEETYFFRLDRYEEKLLKLYEEHPEFIEPESRRNEVISFVKGGLEKLSVSRTSFSWGVPVPGNPKHVMYVWFDALTNYYSALGGEGSELTKRFWNDGDVVHIVGKDILRFHAVYWPAFLLSAGLPLPKKIFAHGFLTVDGEKMSKSLRNAVDPLRLAATEELGGPDGLRYQLLRSISFGQDGDFDHAAVIERYNADLGKNLGNLLSRTLGLCAKLTGGKVPALPIGIEAEESQDGTFIRDALVLADAAKKEWLAYAPHRALEKTMELSSLANGFVDRSAPWAAAKKGDQAAIDRALGLLLAVLRDLSVLIWPAAPRKADQLRAQLSLGPILVKSGSSLWPEKFAPLEAGTVLGAASPLFPTIDKDKEKELLGRLLPPKEVPADASSPIAAGPETISNPAAGSGDPGTITARGILYEDFARVDLRVGLVKSAERVAKKDKLLKLSVDVGEEIPRTIVAGLAQTFTPEALIGRRVVVVANLAPRDFGKGLISHGMLLATGPSDKLQLATIEEAALPGARLK
ncbi:methionine--tRNA ligase [soil metagenome]